MLTQTSEKNQSDLLVLKAESEKHLSFDAGNPFTTDKIVSFKPEDIGSIKLVTKKSDIEGASTNNFQDPVTVFENQLLKFPKNPFAYNNFGLSLMNQKRYSDASKQFIKAIETKMDFYAAKMNLARCYENLEKWDESLDIYSKLLKKSSDDTNILMNIAHLHFIKADYSTTKKYLDLILKNNENPSAYNNRAVLHIITGQFNNAVSDLRKALKINLIFPEALTNLGVCYFIQNSYNKALKYFHEALSILPNNSDIAQCTVRTLHKLSRYQESTSLMINYLENNKFDTSIRELLSRSYLALQKYKIAINQLNIALNQIMNNPPENLEEELPRYLNNFGVIYHQKGELKKAKDYYSRAKKDSKIPNEIVYRNLINLYFDMGNINKVKVELEEANQYFPETIHLLFLNSRYYYEVKNYNKSIECLNKSIKLDARFLSSYTLLSFIYSEVFSNYNEAIRILEEGIKGGKSNNSLLNNLAYNYLMKGEFIKARTILDSIKKDEDNNFLAATRGLLLLKEGNVKEATSLYNHAMFLSSNDPFWKEVIRQKKYLELAKFYKEKSKKLETKKCLDKLFMSKLKSSIIYKQAETLKATLENNQ